MFFLVGLFPCINTVPFLAKLLLAALLWLIVHPTYLLIFIAVVFIIDFIVKKYVPNVNKNARGAGTSYSYTQSNSGQDSSNSSQNTNSGQSYHQETAEPSGPDREIVDAFAQFNLTPEATFSELKERRRMLLKFFHPDHHNEDTKDRAFATERTSQINNAYEFLVKRCFNGQR